MKGLRQWLLLCVLAFAVLQLFFALRIGAMAVLDPSSTTFERSQMWQMAFTEKGLAWRQQWVPIERISTHLQRAVIASEDDTFTSHDGIRWDSIEKAWDKNNRAQQRAEKQAARRPDKSPPAPKVVGGSTISQQLAKNLLLSGERTLLRKGQEMVLTLLLEALLSKERILELYLNHVEWGQGVFGAEAAARHYFRKSAAHLNAWEAARLAVMLPRPRYFEKQPQSAYLNARAQVIVARMGAVALP